MSGPGPVPEALAGAGVPFRRGCDRPRGRAAVEAAGRTWARVWARPPLVEGRSFGDLVQWRGESLLWTAEGCAPRPRAPLRRDPRSRA